MITYQYVCYIYIYKTFILMGQNWLPSDEPIQIMRALLAMGF
jgi:hypothetical protein